MKQEDNELLLRDLCARLPYGVKCTTKSSWNGIYIIEGYKDNRVFLDCPVYDEGDDEWMIESIVPYLRPMSSMTEEERDELELLCDGLDIDDEGNSFYYMSIIKNHKSNTINFKIIDFLISRHFDYRGLIEKGLALEAPEGMYNIKEQ